MQEGKTRLEEGGIDWNDETISSPRSKSKEKKNKRINLFQSFQQN